MKKQIAIIVGKIVTFVCTKIIKKGGTTIGGAIALKIYPKLLEEFEMPKTVVGITGTNGKTTVTNMIASVAKENNISYVSNLAGANMKGGIVTAFLKESTINGKIKKDMAILEMDERFTPIIFKNGFKIDYLVVTNLTRDSMKRNANPDYILEILSHSIPENTKIIVNGDDVIASAIGENAKKYYGIARQKEDRDKPYNIIRDITICPKCSSKLEYEFVRRNHIGKLKCSNPNCDFKNPKLDYEIIEIDKEKEIIRVKNNEKIYEYSIVQNNIYNIYNELAVISLYSEIGLSYEKIKKAISKINITGSRYNTYDLKDGKKLITNLCKGQNPIAGSNVIMSMMEDTKNKTVIIAIADANDDAQSTETSMWLYEVDFEMLKRNDIKRIVVKGPREEDVYVRLLLAGIEKEKIVLLKDLHNIENNLNIDEVENTYLMHDSTILDEVEIIKNNILKKYGEN